MTETQTLVTSAEAAALIAEVSGRSCVPENVRRLARIGQLPPVCVVGTTQQRLFDREAVLQFARARRGARG